MKSLYLYYFLGDFNKNYKYLHKKYFHIDSITECKIIFYYEYLTVSKKEVKITMNTEKFFLKLITTFLLRKSNYIIFLFISLIIITFHMQFLYYYQTI